MNLKNQMMAKESKRNQKNAKEAKKNIQRNGNIHLSGSEMCQSYWQLKKPAWTSNLELEKKSPDDVLKNG